MASVVLNTADFKAKFPAFVTSTDGQIETAFTQATFYLANNTAQCLTLDKLTFLLYLLTAHILDVNSKIATGDTIGTVTSATIDKVSVTMLAPKSSNDLKFWLNQTPYGAQYLALIRTCTSAGFYIGGAPETLAYPSAR